MILQELSHWEIFYWLCGISVAVVALVYLLGSGGRRKGMSLRLRAGASSTKGNAEPSTAPMNYTEPIAFQKPPPKYNVPPPPSYPPNGPRSTGFRPSATERPLNVMFNYNGETWDAYEVLGLPAGSSLEKADEAFKKASSGVDPTSRGFIEAAHRAIAQQWRTYQKASGS